MFPLPASEKKVCWEQNAVSLLPERNGYNYLDNYARIPIFMSINRDLIMAFGYIMLLAMLITPLTMVGFGLAFLKDPPKSINSFYGYRTKRSIKTQDTWNFAHHFCGKLWLICGLVSIPFSLVPVWLVVDKSKEVVSMTGLIVLGIQVVVLLATLIPVERALKNHFDEFGRPR